MHVYEHRQLHRLRMRFAATSKPNHWCHDIISDRLLWQARSEFNGATRCHRDRGADGAADVRWTGSNNDRNLLRSDRPSVECSVTGNAERNTVLVSDCGSQRGLDVLGRAAKDDAEPRTISSRWLVSLDRCGSLVLDRSPQIPGRRHRSPECVYERMNMKVLLLAFVFVLVACGSPVVMMDAALDAAVADSANIPDAIVDSLQESSAEAAIDAPVETGADATIAENSCDQDNDGHRARTCGGDDCDDTNANAYPGAMPRCARGDFDCDGNSDHLQGTATAPWCLSIGSPDAMRGVVDCTSLRGVPTCRSCQDRATNCICWTSSAGQDVCAR